MLFDGSVPSIHSRPHQDMNDILQSHHCSDIRYSHVRGCLPHGGALCFHSRNTGSSGMVHIFLSLPSRYSSSLLPSALSSITTFVVSSMWMILASVIRSNAYGQRQFPDNLLQSDQPVGHVLPADSYAIAHCSPVPSGTEVSPGYISHWQYVQRLRIVTLLPSISLAGTPFCIGIYFCMFVIGIILLYILMDDMALNIVVSFHIAQIVLLLRFSSACRICRSVHDGSL